MLENIVVMKIFAIKTLGCKTNQLESSIIKELLIKEGYRSVRYSEAADFYIVNTCSVTARSDSESVYYIRKAKKTNPDAKIIATGCSAQLNPQDIGADIVVGNAQKLDILDFIKKNNGFVSDIMLEKKFKGRLVKSFWGRTRANIKIQDGCNNRCSYCIIPFARGPSRSDSVENIVKQIKLLTAEGVKEIVLTGIHIGQWGLDLEDKKNFLSLLQKIEQVDSLERYRLGSLEPPEISDDVIEFLANSPKFARHLHISVQSVNNKVLKLMNRKYTLQQVQDTTLKLQSKIKDISLGCDIIAGFPTETDEQFDQGYKSLETMPFSYMHVFPYSIRPGTVAAGMRQINDKKKKERAQKLRILSNIKKENFMKAFIGQELEVLIEKKRHKSGKLKGLSSNYIQVLLDGGDDLMNKILPAKLVSVENGIGLAKLIGTGL